MLNKYLNNYDQKFIEDIIFNDIYISSSSDEYISFSSEENEKKEESYFELIIRIIKKFFI